MIPTMISYTEVDSLIRAALFGIENKHQNIMWRGKIIILKDLIPDPTSLNRVAIRQFLENLINNKAAEYKPITGDLVRYKEYFALVMEVRNNWELKLFCNNGMWTETNINNVSPVYLPNSEAVGNFHEVIIEGLMRYINGT